MKIEDWDGEGIFLSDLDEGCIRVYWSHFMRTFNWNTERTQFIEFMNRAMKNPPEDLYYEDDPAGEGWREYYKEQAS